ncbi:MAG TPA: DUF2219 family protein [Roseibacterium sp.]|nr:DUF2219 family protein [Roseibacterium sp.]
MVSSTRGAAALVLLATAFAAPANAQGSAGGESLGTVQIFTNDWFGMPFGDRFDRWRTGSYQVSHFRGEAWNGTLPSDPFALVEYRFRGEIIAPDNLAAPAAGDRLYAPVLYFGATTHFELRGIEVALGADLVLTGDQTGLMGLHDGIHRTFGGSSVDLANFMIEDGIYFNGIVEGARSLEWGAANVRPFLEVQAGFESLVRAGVDLRFGNFDDEALLIRDPITGQRLIGVPGDNGGGWTFSAGGDVAFVGDSVLLPTSGPAIEDTRYRVRGGVNFAFGPSNFFYGVTYLSEEFVGQSEGQLVGSMSLMLRF